MITLEETADTLKGLGVGCDLPADRHVVSAIRDEREVASWGAVIDQILELYQLKAGWDGEEAPAPSKPLLARAMRVATSLRDLGCLAPCRAVASFDGTVVLEWQDCGNLVELEFLSQDRAELTTHRKGRPTQRARISW